MTIVAHRKKRKSTNKGTLTVASDGDSLIGANTCDIVTTGSLLLILVYLQRTT